MSKCLTNLWELGRKNADKYCITIVVLIPMKTVAKKGSHSLRKQIQTTSESYKKKLLC